MNDLHLEIKCIQSVWLNYYLIVTIRCITSWTECDSVSISSWTGTNVFSLYIRSIDSILSPEIKYYFSFNNIEIWFDFNQTWTHLPISHTGKSSYRLHMKFSKTFYTSTFNNKIDDSRLNTNYYHNNCHPKIVVYKLWSVSNTWISCTNETKFCVTIDV